MASVGTFAQYRLNLLGTFRLLAPDGERIEISSKKGMALIALLAMAHEGERSRAWLQDKLWGTRDVLQGRASLRGELSVLRRRLNAAGGPLLLCERGRVRLDLHRLRVDARDSDSADGLTGSDGLMSGDFLEGLDLAGEDEFEEWLRDQRAALRDRVVRASGRDGPGAAAGRAIGEPAEASSPPLPSRIVDMSSPAPGFAGRPALAVLPFRNLTGDAENEYLSEGISEDLIDRLSRLRWLPVIARGSSFSFGRGEVDHRAVGGRLGAKYLVEGRLRRADEGFALTVDLSDATSNFMLWSHRLEMPSIYSQEALGQCVSDLVGALDTRIDKAEQSSAREKPQSDLNVNDLIWRGRWHINRLTRHDAERARALFAEALALEPESPEALIQSTWALGRSIWAERGSQDEIRRMRDLAQRAIRADPEDGRGHWLAGIAEVWLRQPSRAKALLHRAVTLNPSLAEAHAQLGDAYSLNGEPEMALDCVKTALRLNPTDLLVFAMLSTMATAHWMLGAWREAIDHAEQSIIRRPGYWYGYVIKIGALHGAGEGRRAAATLRELLAAKPNFSADYIDWVPFIDGKWTRALKECVAAAATELGVRLGESRRTSDG